jgi:hypothetical protein
MTASVWRIGQFLNSVQSTFVGLLRVWSIPIVLLLSIASGYTTYYGMSFFITWWIAVIITVAVQSIVVICTLELAGMHWRANLWRFLAISISLLVALLVSISFSYFKFYEFSERDNILIDRQRVLEQDINRYLDEVTQLKSKLVANQRQRFESAAREASQAYLGSHPVMQGEHRNKVGKGPFWSHYNEIQQREKAQLEKLEREIGDLDRGVLGLHTGLKDFSFHTSEAEFYEKVLLGFQDIQSRADTIAVSHGLSPVKTPTLVSFAEFNQGITPTFAMWENISWFALACASMVDFFTVILSYRLEFTAPGPLTEEEKELAFLGLRQFSEFTINRNDELEFLIEKTELERARRFSDWTRMFAVAFLLNRGYLRKISTKSVEFAPNLYPIVAERLKLKREGADLRSVPVDEDKLRASMEKKRYG